MNLITKIRKKKYEIYLELEDSCFTGTWFLESSFWAYLLAFSAPILLMYLITSLKFDLTLSLVACAFLFGPIYLIWHLMRDYDPEEIKLLFLTYYILTVTGEIVALALLIFSSKTQTSIIFLIPFSFSIISFILVKLFYIIRLKLFNVDLAKKIERKINELSGDQKVFSFNSDYINEDGISFKSELSKLNDSIKDNKVKIKRSNELYVIVPEINELIPIVNDNEVDYEVKKEAEDLLNKYLLKLHSLNKGERNEKAKNKIEISKELYKKLNLGG